MVKVMRRTKQSHVPSSKTQQTHTLQDNNTKLIYSMLSGLSDTNTITNSLKPTCIEMKTSLSLNLLAEKDMYL